MEGMPWIADDRKVVLPPREELHTSMESLIHHFKIVTRDSACPRARSTSRSSRPRGESGCYLVSDGGPKPWRIHFRAPSFVALEATATCLENALGRRPDRGGRLARRRDGGHRPVTSFYDEVQELRARYPEGTLARRSCPRFGSRRRSTAGCLARPWRRPAEALELTPAYCYSVASFYDMLHVEPIGQHTIEVCTNVCCGLVNAQAVLDAFEQELGVAPARRPTTARSRSARSSASAAARRRPIVAVDHRYRQSVTPEDVPAIVGECGG
jgi:hypothetical protein